MNKHCICCDHSVDDRVAFCAKHTPRFGEIKRFKFCGKRTSLFVGEVTLWNITREFFTGAKIARWWVGSDVLLLKSFPLGRGKLSVFRHRLLKFISEPFISMHWINGDRLLCESNGLFPNKKMCLWLWGGAHSVVYGKIAHTGINIAYYFPRNDVYSRWVYGLDLIEKFQEKYQSLLRDVGIEFIVLNGTMKMPDILPYLDGYIRPSRWDGWPRLVQECRVNNVPVYYSENGKPSVEEMFEFIKGIVDGKN